MSTRASLTTEVVASTPTAFQPATENTSVCVIRDTREMATTAIPSVITICWQNNSSHNERLVSQQSDQSLRGPHVAWQQQLSLDIWCARPTSAANPPTAAAADDRRDRRTLRHSTVLWRLPVEHLYVRTSVCLSHRLTAATAADEFASGNVFKLLRSLWRRLRVSVVVSMY